MLSDTLPADMQDELKLARAAQLQDCSMCALLLQYSPTTTPPATTGAASALKRPAQGKADKGVETKRPKQHADSAAARRARLHAVTSYRVYMNAVDSLAVLQQQSEDGQYGISLSIDQVAGMVDKPLLVRFSFIHYLAVLFDPDQPQPQQVQTAQELADKTFHNGLLTEQAGKPQFDSAARAALQRLQNANMLPLTVVIPAQVKRLHRHLQV